MSPNPETSTRFTDLTKHLQQAQQVERAAAAAVIAAFKACADGRGAGATVDQIEAQRGAGARVTSLTHALGKLAKARWG